jgi:homoserine acetyltransferase
MSLRRTSLIATIVLAALVDARADARGAIDFAQSSERRTVYGLLSPGQPLDAARHYLIFPDNLGNGRSTKPSDGLRARFPRYGYADMVALQHRLVTEHLRIERLRLIIGISMGAMHTWMWGVKYPEAMSALVLIAALPTPIQGRNLLWRTILTQAIRDNPQWNNGELNPTELGVMERVMRRVKNGRGVLVPSGPETEGHGTQVKARVWRDHVREFLRNVQ